MRKVKDMNNKDIKKDCKKLLIISILFSIGFVVGIPAIIFGAIYGGAMIALMVVGIIMVVCGFYGAPILWIAYGEKVKQSSIYDMITVDGITDVKTISNSIGNANEEQVKRIIKILIEKRYLTGYKFEKDEVSTTNKKIKNHKCPNCGANLTEEYGKWVCTYCNSTLDK